LKTDDSLVLKQGLKYRHKGNNSKITAILKNEQRHFCAYTEKFLSPTEATEIEHFDPRLKGTAEDSYYNWYAVIRFSNLRKKSRIDNFLPIIKPEEASGRFIYIDHTFHPKNPDDIEALNFRDFLRLNHPSLVEDRKNHAARIKELFKLWAPDPEEQFFEWLSGQDLSFVTSIEHELPEHAHMIIIPEISLIEDKSS
ncbi:MAG: hypothetical protein AAF226_14245, partial [Verrucomicrobiota bacterium]